jgi:hypothetical protein
VAGQIWHDLVDIGVPAGEKIIRTVLVYLVVLGLLHASKRSLSQLNTLDFAVLLLQRKLA